MRVLVKPTRATSKGELKTKDLHFDKLEDIPETIPCGNPDCVGGTIPLRATVLRALGTMGKTARGRCACKEKSGLPCWNMVDLAVREDSEP